MFKDATSPLAASISDSKDEPVTWEQAQKERSDIEDSSSKKAQEEMLRKQEEEAKAKMEEVRKQQEQIRLQMQKEYEGKLKALQSDENEKKKLELEMKKKEEERRRKLEEEEQKIIRKQQEQNDLERRLGVILPLVNEANLISKELKRDIKFNVKLVKTLPETNADGTTDLPKTDILIKVDNFKEGYYYQWPEGKFNDRVFMMRDLLEEYFDTEVIPEVSQENDPFWDPPEPQLIG